MGKGVFIGVERRSEIEWLNGQFRLKTRVRQLSVMTQGIFYFLF